MLTMFPCTLLTTIFLLVVTAVMMIDTSCRAFVIRHQQPQRTSGIPKHHLLLPVDTSSMLPKCTISGKAANQRYSRQRRQSFATTTSPTTGSALFLGNGLMNNSDSAPLMINADVNSWIIFVIGIVPFVWATVEFWRRIAVGEPFGTGKDSIYIGKNNVPDESRGRRILDRGAFVVAYVLFGIAATTIAIVLYSVITSSSPPVSLPQATTTTLVDNVSSVSLLFQ